MESELTILEGLAGDLNWADEFNELYDTMLCNAKLINDRKTLIKMRIILLNQIRFMMAERLKAALEEGMLENISNFN